MEEADHRFGNRRDAGRQLSALLSRYLDQKPVVLALPRGGVPVGYEVSKALEAPLDVLLVRKIGAPAHPELAIGAVVDGANPQVVLNEQIVQKLGIGEEYIKSEEKRQFAEIERRRLLYHGGRMALDISGRTIIVVDDGIATGATVRAALLALARSTPARLVLAVPVAAPACLEELKTAADDIVCISTPDGFRAVGDAYEDFTQTSDEEVIDILANARYNALQAPQDLEVKA
jgi:putative phosphoribosyl transferase